MPKISENIILRLNQAIDAGSFWRDALVQLTHGTRLREHAERAGELSLANWLWLSNTTRRERALVVDGEMGATAASLASSFAEVHVMESEPLSLSFTRRRFAQDRLESVAHVRASPDAPPFAPGSFDCIALRLPLRRSGSPRRGRETSPELHDLFRACYGLLRPGGCVGIMYANPLYYRNLVKIGRGRHPFVARTLQRIGFGDIQDYYVIPSADEPRSIVPAVRTAVRAYESLVTMPASKRLLRRLVVRLGCHVVLAPARLILAHR